METEERARKTLDHGLISSCRRRKREGRESSCVVV